MTEFFELSHEQNEDLEISDDETYRAYLRDFVVGAPELTLTPEQQYLRSLQSIIDPVMTAIRLTRRINRLKTRKYKINASSNFEESAKLLSMEAYHFKERIRFFSEKSRPLIVRNDTEGKFINSIGKIIQKFQNKNKRLIKFRNFVVHGPKDQIDEFAPLRGIEICAILIHNDIWLEYDNIFHEFQSDWTEIGRTLVASMKVAIVEVQNLNQKAISNKSFSFAC